MTAVKRIAQHLAVSGALALAPLGLQSLPASAGHEWCFDDPPVQVVVQGQPVTVNTYVGVPVQQRQQARGARVSGYASGTSVVVTIEGVHADFRAYGRIGADGLSAGDPAAVYAAGQTVTLVFPDVHPA